MAEVVHSRALDIEEIALDATISTVILTSSFFLVRSVVGTSPRRTGWILSLTCAVVMSVVGLPVALRTNIEPDGWEEHRILSCRSRSGRFLSTFVLVYMLQDMLTSIVHYPSEMELLTGWIHHIFYMLLSYASLKFGFSELFAIFSPMEWSSIFLGMGHVFPERRSDLGFGISFFLVRILYFGYSVYQVGKFNKLLCFIGCLPLLVHCYWFARWCRSYSRRRRQLKQQRQQRQQHAKAA